MERQGAAAWAKAGGWDQVVQDARQGDMQLVWAGGPKLRRVHLCRSLGKRVIPAFLSFSHSSIFP